MDGLASAVGPAVPSDPWRLDDAGTGHELRPVRSKRRPRPVTDDGDHDRFAHYAKKADIARAYVTGEAIVALCGKK